jgi:hypothetical protein
MLLAWHPYSGRECVQMIGMDYHSHFVHNNSFYQGISKVSSASLSQSNFDLTSKFGNTSTVALKTIGSSNAAILHSNHTTNSSNNSNNNSNNNSGNNLTHPVSSFPVSLPPFPSSLPVPAVDGAGGGGGGIATYDSFCSGLSDYRSKALQLTPQNMTFLYDLYTQRHDYQCGGGRENRFKTFQSFRENEFSSVLDFIRLCSDYELVDSAHPVGGLTSQHLPPLHQAKQQKNSDSIDIKEPLIFPERRNHPFSSYQLYDKDNVGGSSLLKRDDPFSASTLESFSAESKVNDPNSKSNPTVLMNPRKNNRGITEVYEMGGNEREKGSKPELAKPSFDEVEDGRAVSHSRSRSSEIAFVSSVDSFASSKDVSVPVTLICGQLVQVVPWEGVLSDLKIVRNIGLMPLIMQLLEPKPLSSSMNTVAHVGQASSASPLYHSSTAVNTQLSNLLAFSISTDSPLPSPTNNPSEANLFGTTIQSEDCRRGNSCDSFASSASSPSISAQFHNQEMKVRGFLGPDLFSKPFYLTLSWDSSLFSSTLNHELQLLTRKKQSQTTIESILRLNQSYELTRSFHSHIQFRNNDLNRPSSAGLKEDKTPRNLDKYQ